MKLQIIFQDWERDCEDGSCYEYGTSLIVNGKRILDTVTPERAVRAVLDELGIEYEIKND
ncbi:hypothetical protein [Peribacillus sp. SCS-37]|uniref:hypothetical protein n=1 Tax=Paraperibacillus esterisolvens TaxID=3115296 RepID=UPI003905A760